MMVHKSLEKVAKSFCNCLERKNIISNIELTGQQAITVGFIHHLREVKGCVIQRDVERFFNQRRSTVSNMIDRLEEKGYLQREKTKEDLRTKQLLLTKKAEENIHLIKSYAYDIENMMLDGISEDEINIFNCILDKMIYNLSKED